VRLAQTLLSLIWVSSLILLSSCGHEECSCFQARRGDITIHTPLSSSPRIIATGPACTGATIMCLSSGPGGCVAYDVMPTQTGECDLEVNVSGGVFKATVNIVKAAGCCGASIFVTENEVDEEMTFPPADAGSRGDASVVDSRAD
jgi:hypothetical protein